MTYEFVKKWTKKVDVFKKKYLVIPINEKLHWYLAILVNPYYAVREVEKKNNLYQPESESDDCEEEEKEFDRSFSGEEHNVKDNAEDEVEAAVGPSKDADGDVQMAEGNDIPAKAGSPDDAAISEGDPDTDMLDRIKAPFPSILSEEELMEGYMPKPKLQSPVFKVHDVRSTTSTRQSPRTPISTRHTSSLGDDEEEVQILRSVSGSARKQGSRPGISDGINNTGRGKMRGGGGKGIPITPGESFAKVSPEPANRVVERGTSEETYSLPSPPRSRSGATYGGKTATFSRRESAEEVFEKHRDWLKQKAVVCVFDSLDGKHKAVRTALREYLSLEYNDKRGGDIEAMDVDLEHIDVMSPSQGNYCDCGLYLLHSFERFINDPKLVLRKVIPSRNRNHDYWQVEEAKTKREWWKEKVNELAEQWETRRERVLADREARNLAKEAKSKSSSKEPEEEEEKGGRGGGDREKVRLSDEAVASNNAIAITSGKEEDDKGEAAALKGGRAVETVSIDSSLEEPYLYVEI